MFEETAQLCGCGWDCRCMYVYYCYVTGQKKGLNIGEGLAEITGSG